MSNLASRLAAIPGLANGLRQAARERATTPVNLAIAEAFIAKLTGSPDTTIRLRFFHDSDENNKASFEIGGTIRDLWPQVEQHQRNGFGCFYFPNEISNLPDQWFAKDGDVIAIRTLATDHDDGLPEKYHKQPTMTVKTSVVNGIQKGQALWTVTGMDVKDFKPAQRALAAYYQSDKAICNRSRVLRLPGSHHLKDPSNPQLVTFEDHSDLVEDQRTAADILTGLPAQPAPKPPGHNSGQPIAEKVLREAAAFVDPFDGRADWLPLVISLRTANITGDEDGETTMRQVVHEWCVGDLDTADRFQDINRVYSGPDAVNELLDTTKVEGDIHLGTFLEAARKGGWNGDPHSTGEPPSKTFEGFADRIVPEQQQNQANEGDRFELLEPHNFKDRPAPKWIVDGMIAAKRTHILFGQSETMKTFLTLDLVASVANNVLAFGKFEVYDPGDAVFFCDEDPDDLMLVRYPAWCKARGIENPFANPGRGPGRLVIIPRCPLIIDPSDTDAAIALIKAKGLKPKVVAVDTWAKAMVGMNEDSAKDTGLLFQAMGVIRREFDCATWLTHHPKKNEAT
jgi:hypothetical protein